MTDKTMIVSAAVAAVLVSAIVAGPFSVPQKSYAQNPIKDLIGNATSTGKNLIGNLTGAGNQTSPAGNQTSSTGNQTVSGNQTGLPLQNGKLTGRIASIQQDLSKPAWILAGIWKLEERESATSQPGVSNATTMTGGNNTITTTGNATITTGGNATVTTTPNGNTTITTGNGTATTVTGNNTTVKGQVNSTNTSTTSGSGNQMKTLTFVAKIEMVRPNGTAYHEHEVSDLKVTKIGNDEFGNPTINGTVTVTMQKGPVQDVPVTIKIINKAVFAMTLGPDKIDNHFGTDPILGTVAQRS
jgi:hypothetical protein